MEVRLEKNLETEEMIEESGLELLDYNSRNNKYRINLKAGDVDRYSEALIKLIELALGIEEN
ncbi:MAG: hypothetical protein L0I79_01440 [Atopostipes sp.]|nr:hypothetical protein [Atopostipes sp.]